MNQLFLHPVVFVFLGGGIGSLVRWYLSTKLNPIHAHFPIGTLVVNLIGAFIIGLILALVQKNTGISTQMKLLLTTGFCGGLTTFSTFSWETFQLLYSQQYLVAIGSITLNLVGSLLMTALAFYLIQSH